MIYSKIKKLLKDRNMTVPQLAEKIGMTKGGLYAAIENNTLSVKTLEKIAEVFDVPITSFFEDENDNLSKTALIAEVKRLEELKSALYKQNDILLDYISARRSLFRLLFMNAISMEEIMIEWISKTDNELIIEVFTIIAKRIKGTALSINEIEHFDTEEAEKKEDNEYDKRIKFDKLFFSPLKVSSKEESKLTVKATTEKAKKASKD